MKHVNKSGRNKYLWLQIEFSCEGINMHVTIMLAVNREIEKTENTITRDLTFAPIPPSGKLSEGFFYLFPHFWNDTPGSWEMFINFSWMNISRLFRKKNKSLRFNVATHVLMIWKKTEIKIISSQMLPTRGGLSKVESFEHTIPFRI